MTPMRELASRHRFYIGLDLGQRQDYTALTVLDRAEVTYAERDPVTAAYITQHRLTARYCERIPLGTEYPDMVRRVAQIVKHPSLNNAVTLAIDATGVGAPVVDLLRREKLHCNLLAIILTGGQTPSRTGSFATVPRRDLLINLQVMIEKRRLHLSKGMDGFDDLKKELAGLRERKTVEDHDDLAFSLALAAWAVRVGGAGQLLN